MRERIEKLAREVQSLRESAERFESLFEFAPDPYYLSDVKGVLLDGNKAAEALTGYEKEELIGSSFMELDLLPLSQVPKAMKLLAMNAIGKPTGPDTFTLRSKSGRCVEVEISTVPMEIAGETRVLGIARDVTERKRMLDALRESEDRYQRAASAGRVGVWEWDLRTNGMFLDPALKALLGYEEHEIQDHMDDWARHVHPDDAAAVETAVKPCLEGVASTFDVEHRMVHKDGSIRWFLGRGTVIRDDGGAPIRMVGSDVDVTEHKRVEQQRSRLEAQTRLLQSQRLESLGVLAGGVAHDFNNMLTTILGNASLALSKLDSESPLHRLLQRIEEGALRASELTNQLLAYSGKGRFLVEPVRLNGLASEMVGLLEISVSKKAALRLELAEDDPVVEADASQMRQVIMNLVLNASDSVHAVGGGIVTVATDLTRVAERPTEPGGPEAPSAGSYAVLEVTDTGEGMDGERRARVFEPFFTTKEPGRGLGLAAVEGIVRGHRGFIEIQSEAGAGTVVRVLLPAASSSPREPDAVAPAKPRAFDTGEVVLVVDDESSVREVAARILEDEGFRVLTASDGASALSEFQSRRGEVALVLLDLTMPDMDGDAVIDRLRADRADVPVILMSGYDEQRSIHPLRGAQADGFLKKPFRSRELISTLSRCLNRR